MNRAAHLACFWSRLLIFVVFASAPHPSLGAETESLSLPQLAKRTRPAVVLIITSDRNGKELATGSGFFISADGRLVTNRHVIEGAASAIVKTEDGAIYLVAGSLSISPRVDLAILQVSGRNLPTLSLGRSEAVEVGERIAVIGSPLGLEGSLSDGLVSARRGLPGEGDMLQITAAISPGSSGSPVLNAAGEVIGVATLASKAGIQSLNFAVPAEEITGLLRSLPLRAAAVPLKSPREQESSTAQTDPEFIAASAAMKANNNAKALKLLQSVAQRFPNDYFALSTLGGCYGNLRFYPDAELAFRHAIKARPDYAPAWQNLAILLGMMNRPGDAVGAIEQALKLEPENPKNWEIAAEGYGAVGRPSDAAAAKRQVEKLNASQTKSASAIGVVPAGKSPPGAASPSSGADSLTSKRQAFTRAQESDRQLNAVYSALRARLNPSGKQQLRDLQKQWLETRAARVLDSELLDKGMAADPEALRRFAEMNEARTVVLREVLRSTH